ncbi:hypothetical protein DEQ92_20100 [Haloferax sp. Atlit-6N]|nr:hypothetical protein [Haloferax gibbonsii]REA00592.1 hypothetical protein DEQ92_20100 [Haloferax sp. Atlit-6N]
MRRRLAHIEWDAVAGILAAVLALVLHFLHIVDESVLLMISLVLLALLFLRDLRRESEAEELAESVTHTERTVQEIRHALEPGDLELIGPGSLRPQSRQFCESAGGEMIWFNVCLLMFVPQDLFDTLLRPAIENSDVTSVQFVLDESERELWETQVKPKVAECRNREVVKEPIWRDLDENVSFILGGTADDRTDALLSFWGEPFMARTTRDVPRYIIHVTADSELIPQLRDIEREHRLQRT